MLMMTMNEQLHYSVAYVT